MDSERKERGARFRELCRFRRVKFVAIARQYGVSPQVVYSWCARGVSKEYAVPIAKQLRCAPHEISKIITAEPVKASLDAQTYPSVADLVALLRRIDMVPDEVERQLLVDAAWASAQLIFYQAHRASR